MLNRDVVLQPFDRSLEEFLAGQPDITPLIDPLFSCEFDSLVRNYDPDVFKSGLEQPATLTDGYKFRILEAKNEMGVALISACNNIVGAYIGCSLAIAEDHRGKGLGAELSFEFADFFGELPTWFLDTPAYSPAGFAAHRRAWYLARDPSFIAKRNSKRHPLKRCQPNEMVNGLSPRVPLL